MGSGGTTILGSSWQHLDNAEVLVKDFTQEQTTQVEMYLSHECPCAVEYAHTLTYVQTDM